VTAPTDSLVAFDDRAEGLYRFAPLADQPGLTHVVTGGNANLATHLGAGCEHAVDHRRRICAVLGLDFARLTSTRQVHGAEVFGVDAEAAGTGCGERDGSEPAADALMTDVPGVALLALSADCPLVLVYDPARAAVGVAHASWKGTVGGIAARLVSAMCDRLGCDPKAMVAAVAPSAGPCCYEVGAEVVDDATASLPDAPRHFKDGSKGRPHFDLWSANSAQLTQAGLARDRITIANVCTICDRRFFSYRREGPDTGRFALIAAINAEFGVRSAE
jgi:hypothetical protein